MRSVGQMGGYSGGYPGGMPPGRRPRRGRIIRRKEMPLWQELPLLLIVAFCLAVLIRTFLVQAFFIPSGSMQQTLEIKDRVLVNKVIYDVRNPERGEIVVFRGPETWASETPSEPVSQAFSAKLGRTVGDLVGVSRPGERDFIKRVIGVAGDKVACCDQQGRVTVNGKSIDEPYIFENSSLDAPPNPRQCTSRIFAEVTVPADQIFVMGDHRGVSQDARCQGPVPVDNVIGRAFVIVWPTSRFTSLEVPPNWKTFAMPAEKAPDPDPETGALFLPFLLTAGLSARSGLPFVPRRRRLRS
jgi:signal peptidase I